MKVMLAIAANVVLVAAAIGYGTLLKPLLPPSRSSFDRFGIVLLGGVGIFGTLLFLVGQFCFSLLTVVLLSSIGVLIGTLVTFGGKRTSISTRPTRVFPIVPVVVVAYVLAITAVGGLTAPTGDIGNDSIAYHYLGPKVWLRNGVIRPLPDETHTAFPAIVETGYAALMALGGQTAPQFFSVVSISVLLLITFGLSLSLGLDDKAIWWVIALVVTMPAVYRGAYGGFIDAIYAAFILAAARVGFDAQKIRNYALFGLFCGFAMGTKYTGLIAWPLLVVCVILIAWSSSSISKITTLRNVAIASAIAIAVASPWYIRNWVLLGCPIYPPPYAFLLQIFHVKYLSVSAVEQFHQYMLLRGRGMGHGLADLLLLPFRLTYHTANFHGAGGIGLAPLALAPLGIFAYRRHSFANGLALFALLETVAWFATDQESRFLIQVYAIAAVFAAAGWRYAQRIGTRRARVLCGLVITISIAYGLFMISSGRAEDLHAALSSTFAADRQWKEEPFKASFDFLNNERGVSKVLILDPDVPAYYCDKAYLKPVGNWGEQTLTDATDIDRILDKSRAVHVSHVLDTPDQKGAFRLPPNARNLTLVFERKDQRVYRFEP